MLDIFDQLPPDKNDLLNFVKLTPNMIFTLEHSELCHIFNTLPGFVPYPRDRLVLEQRGIRQAKNTKARTKKDSSAGQQQSNGTPAIKAGESEQPQQSTLPATTVSFFFFDQILCVCVCCHNVCVCVLS